MHVYRYCSYIVGMPSLPYNRPIYPDQRYGCSKEDDKRMGLQFSSPKSQRKGGASLSDLTHSHRIYFSFFFFIMSQASPDLPNFINEDMAYPVAWSYITKGLLGVFYSYWLCTSICCLCAIPIAFYLGLWLGLYSMQTFLVTLRHCLCGSGEIYP